LSKALARDFVNLSFGAVTTAGLDFSFGRIGMDLSCERR
jgi:hypothetical protein